MVSGGNDTSVKGLEVAMRAAQVFLETSVEGFHHKWEHRRRSGDKVYDDGDYDDDDDDEDEDYDEDKTDENEPAWMSCPLQRLCGCLRVVDVHVVAAVTLLLFWSCGCCHVCDIVVDVASAVACLRLWGA